MQTTTPRRLAWQIALDLAVDCAHLARLTVLAALHATRVSLRRRPASAR